MEWERRVVRSGEEEGACGEEQGIGKDEGERRGRRERATARRKAPQQKGELRAP